MLQGTARAKALAKKLRRDMTLPEVLLWQRLRTRPNGLKFRRQHDAGNFILDFYCHQARLIIEVDGLVHDRGDRPGKDAARDAEFAAKGLQVLRIPASEVLRNPDEVAQAIAAIGTARR